MDTLAPAERLAFVLHDMFAVPYDEIAPVVERTPAAARQLASRARRQVRSVPGLPETDVARQREVVDAFLAAARGGDFGVLLALLDPEAELSTDAAAALAGVSPAHGAAAVAETFVGRAKAAQPALIGAPRDSSGPRATPPGSSSASPSGTAGSLPSSCSPTPSASAGWIWNSWPAERPWRGPGSPSRHASCAPISLRILRCGDGTESVIALARRGPAG